METTLKLAIETYSKLTNNSFEYVQNEILKGNQTIKESVMMLMFSIA